MCEILILDKNLDLPIPPWPDRFPPEKDASFAMRRLLLGCMAMEQMLRLVAVSYYSLDPGPDDL